MADAKQDIIYLETDEDITSAIDKLNRSKAPSVAIVAPKRSTLIQSLINLRLLKKSADDADKYLVLVTGDRTATHLAGRLGIDVAATLGGKAAVPTIAGEEPKDEPEVITEDASDPTPAESAAMSAAVASAAIAKPKKRTLSPAVESTDEPAADISDDLGEDSADEEPEIRSKAIGTDEPVVRSALASPLPAHLSTRVPNFTTMQKRLTVGGIIVLSLITLWGLNTWMAKAEIRLYARGDAVANDFNFTIDPAAKASDPGKSIVIGQAVATTRDATATLTATGKKDVGTKASGQITLSNKCYNPGTIASGTTFTASNGKLFVSTEPVAVPNGIVILGSCAATTAKIPVLAKENGDSYNLAPTSYTNPSLPSSGLFYVTLTGSQMSGGTTKNITVVTQADIDKAKADAVAKDMDPAKAEATSKVASGYAAIDTSFTQITGDATPSPALDAEGSTGTVTVHLTYSLLAYNRADLETLANQTLKLKVPTDVQVYDNGNGDAKITPTATSTYHYAAQAYVGIRIDTEKIKADTTGKRYGDAVDYMSKLPGIEKVEIDLSPRWNSQLPIFVSHTAISLKVAPKN